jgi:hypothetical protein
MAMPDLAQARNSKNWKRTSGKTSVVTSFANLFGKVISARQSFSASEWSETRGYSDAASITLLM